MKSMYIPEELTLRNLRDLGWEITEELYSNSDVDEVLKCNSKACGSGWFSTMLCYVLQKMRRVNFSMACLIHDLEWGVVQKSIDHRIESNANFELNLILCMHSGITEKKLELASWFHAAVGVNHQIYYSS